LEEAEKFDLKVAEVILFGSRARGDFREDIDWDILVVLENETSKKLTDELLLEIQRSLVKMGISPEVIIVDKKTLYKYKYYTGYVYHYALSEGIPL